MRNINKRFINRKSVVYKEVDFNRTIAQLLLENGIKTTSCEINNFSKWLIKDSWDRYQNYCMDQRVIAMNTLNSVQLNIPNATQGKPYKSEIISLPIKIVYDYKFDGLEALGLEATCINGQNEFIIHGNPIKAGDFNIILRCKYLNWCEGSPLLEKKINFAVNPDPRSLWRDIPTPQDIPYYKPDTATEYIKVLAGEDGEPRKDIVAASNRGRSHAQEGKPRDDHFQLYYCPESEWYIMAVADGAGSAKYSRKGSEVACKTVIEFCKEKLSNSENLESLIRSYKFAEVDDEETARKNLGNEIYSIVGNAVFRAHKAINETVSLSEDKEAKTKDFATTLLLAICKKFRFGWFIASFWVGDGAMCIYNKCGQTIKILGVPDEGEFSGQTRFLTMPEIFADYSALYRRLRFSIVDDFTALMLMTDGVSDPMFGTDANLNDISKWNELWVKLQTGFPEDNISGVELTDDNENSKNQLLEWLNFWKAGEHDDRTIAILY